MQAGAYDTILILFYFSLSPFLLPFPFLSAALNAQPLFSQRPTLCTRLAGYYRLPTHSQVIISHYHYALIWIMIVRHRRMLRAHANYLHIIAQNYLIPLKCIIIFILCSLEYSLMCVIKFKLITVSTKVKFKAIISTSWIDRETVKRFRNKQVIPAKSSPNHKVRCIPTYIYILQKRQLYLI